MTTKYLVSICGIIIAIVIYYPKRHARHYDYIEAEDVLENLVFDKPANRDSNLKFCRYEDLILNNREIDIESIYQEKQYRKPEIGGAYAPQDCIATIKSSVIVPYRNRTQHLKLFLNFFHNYLQNQNLSYRIIIVEQNNTLPFNRARLLNYGAKVAIQLGYPCLILHDVDLIPICTGNIYGCAKMPRHVSSSLDSFRFNLPYLTLFGGVVATRAEHFRKINGMSNVYWGWGGEDDDFYRRFEVNNLLPYRFTPKLSKYTMLTHKKEKASPDRFMRLESTIERLEKDGLNNLDDRYLVKYEDLYTLVIVS